MAINILKQTSYANTTAYNNRPIKHIVIHYTAGTTSRSGTAYNTAMMFSNPSVYASADFIVDDSNIVQFNPDIKNRYCWHCGDAKNNNKGGKYYGTCQNYNSIGIEVCSSNKTGQMTSANDNNYYFTDAVIAKAVELTKYLMKTYGIPASNVIRHYDVTGKYCPGIKGWNEDSGSTAAWESFKSKLADSSVTATTQATTTTSTAANSDKSFLVSIKATDLNIRSGAGLKYPSNGFIPPSVYTIVETKSSDGYTWGRLKSGAGWIALEYAEKV